MLMAPFHGKDKRLFEDLIPFRAITVDGNVHRMIENKRSKFEGVCSVRSPKVPCDALLARRRNARGNIDRPWRKPSSVTQKGAKILWTIFEDIDEDGDNVVELSDICAALDPYDGKINQWRDKLGCGNDEHLEGAADMEALHLFHRLSSPEFKDRVQEGSNSVSLQGFTVMCWPRIKVTEVRMVLGWMQKFKAQKVLKDIFRSVYSGTTDPDLHVEDIKYLFECMDIDKDGILSVEEMVKDESLSRNEAEFLIKKLDTNHNGKLTLPETMQVVLGKEVALGAVANSLKGAFAAAQR